MNIEQNNLWDKVLEILKSKLNKGEYSLSVASINFLKIEDSKIFLEAENIYTRDRFKKYISLAEQAIKSITENIYEIEVLIKEEKTNEVFEQKIVKKYNKNDFKENVKIYENNLNKKYLFSNFIVGKNNEFAHAAAEGVAVSQSRLYNPLFIYGGVGLGKTHLMHAVGNYIYSKNPESRIYYCSSEQFTNDLINSLKSDRMGFFREKYRNLDLLLIDDIQFIAGKESTQEEFFYTFNALHQQSKQIIISSDRPPQEINNIEERLISRFTWGLTADIKAPNYETRVAILKNKAELENIQISYEAISYIAERINSNIRELEGALNQVLVKSSLTKRAIDFDLIEDTFQGFLDSRSKLVTKDKIIKTISNIYKIDKEIIKSKSREESIVKLRHLCIYFFREILNLSYKNIGEFFDNKHHTTIMHSLSKINFKIKNDKNFAEEIYELRQKILK